MLINAEPLQDFARLEVLTARQNKDQILNLDTYSDMTFLSKAITSKIVVFLLS